MTAISAAPLAALVGTMSVPVDQAGGSAARTTIDGLSDYVIGRTLNAQSYGVKPDGMVINDVRTTSGANTVSSTSYGFTAADVGKLIAIPGAGLADGSRPLCAYIGSVTGGVASLVTTSGGSTAANAAVTITSTTARMGTENTAAFQSVAAAASQRYQATGSPVTIELPEGIMVLSDTIPIYSGVSWRGKGRYNSVLKYIKPAFMNQAVFFDGTASNTNPFFDVRWISLGIDLTDAYVNGYFVGAKHLYATYLVRTVVYDCYFVGSPATSVGIDVLVDSIIDSNVFAYSARENNGSQSGGAAIGIGTSIGQVTVAPGVTRLESCLVTRNIIFAPRRWGIFFECLNNGRSNGQFIVAENVIYMTSVSIGHGISDSGNIGFSIVNNRVHGVGVGTGIAARRGFFATGGTGTRGQITGNIVTGTEIGIKLDYEENTAPSASEYSVTKNKVFDCARHGIQILMPTTAANTVSHVDLSDNEIANNGGSGVSITGSAPLKYLKMQDATIRNNGTGASGNRSGIYFGVSVDRVRLEGTDIFDEKATPTQQYGIETASGVAVTNARLPAYSFDGHVTAGIGGAGTLTGTKLTAAAYP